MKIILVIAALFAVCSSSFGKHHHHKDSKDTDNEAKEMLQQHAQGKHHHHKDSKDTDNEAKEVLQQHAQGKHHHHKDSKDTDNEAKEMLQQHAQEPRCSSDADVVFILDRSRSISHHQFKKGKKFLQDVVRLFTPETSRFAFITFAKGATIEFSLDTYGYNQTATLDAIQDISQQRRMGGKTQTWAALELLYNNVLALSNLRRGVHPTVLLITDGASQETKRTANEARKAQSRGIKIIAIGIGNGAKMLELKAIASDPDKDNVHMVNDYSESLNAITDVVGTQVCPFNLEGCKNTKALDVMFSMSEHANADQTRATFNFISTILKKATMGPGKMQFGLERRDCATTWPRIALNAMDTVEDFEEKFSSHMSAFTNLLDIRLSNLERDSFLKGDQTNAKNVAVVFIDKKSDINHHVITRASEMSGIHVIIMAGGDVKADDVSGISRDVIHFGDYKHLASKVKDLSDKLCEAAAPPPAPKAARGPTSDGESVLQIEVFTLSEELNKLKVSMERFEKEQQFYFGKLRDIQVLCQKYGYELVIGKILEMLDAREDGFASPEDKGLDGNEDEE